VPAQRKYTNMPNHITNHIILKCNLVTANLVSRNITRHGNIDFNTLIPCPLHIYTGDTGTRHDKRFIENSWSYWNRANWGTKWNAYDTIIKYGIKETIIEFQTAWAPPFPFITAISNKFPRLKFTHKYIDEGWNFAGTDEWGNGRLQDGSRLLQNWRVDKPYFERLDLEVRGIDKEEKE